MMPRLEQEHLSSNTTAGVMGLLASENLFDNETLDRDISDLKEHGYYYCYLNLLSVLGDKLPVRKIKQIAVQCIKNTFRHEQAFNTYLAQLPEKVDSNDEASYRNQLAKLNGWDFNLLDSLLARKKGLIICTHHFGLYRNIATDLMLRNYKVLSPVDRAAYNELANPLTALNYKLFANNGNVNQWQENDQATGSFTNVVCVSDKDFSLKLFRALEKNEIIIVFIDGNSGWDGPWGNKSRVAIDFLNLSIAVKNGVARIAAAMGTPILPVLALEDSQQSDSGKIILGNPIIPPIKRNRAEKEAFTHNTMQSLYKFLEPYALQYPQLWEGSRFSHRWRIPLEQSSQDNPNFLINGTAEMKKMLTDGAVLKINEREFVNAETATGMVWISVKTLKSYKHSEWVNCILHSIRQHNGLTQAWLDQHSNDPVGQEKILSALVSLKALGIITIEQ